ncbi:MAG TPA: DUF6259 domain-containing protein [Candidatus Kryptobacter bacterium]|nr:DUF6259 domain-containing protein [Candidatus Kryptobacter bacterium]
MRAKFMLFAIFLTSLRIAAVAGAQTRINPADGLTLRNSLVEFKFAPHGMGLEAMTDLKTGYEHIHVLKGKALLWQVIFGKGLQRESITNNYTPCNYASLETLPDGTQHLDIEWNNMRWWKESRVVSVRVTVDLPANSGVAKWRIYVQNNSDYWGLWDVQFPKLNGFPAPGEYDIARPAFATGGLLYKDCRENVEGTFHGRYPSGGWPMQLMAFTHSTSSVYLATMDPNGTAKDFQADAGRGDLAVIHYPENMGIAGSDWPGYYPVEFGVYQGDWLQAALRYREWATRQKWAKPLSERKDIPAIMKNLGLWVRDFWVWDSTKGSPEQMNAPLIRAQKEMGVPVGLHWYFWSKNRFDNDYPHFFPPKPGFERRVKELVHKGFLVMPYINGRSADMNIHDWKEYAPYATYDQAGGFILDTTGLSGRLVEMCPSSEVWQDKIVQETDSLIRDYDCNGVYVDQVSAMRDELCFSKNHEHPLGGGRWWTDGNREMMRKIENVAHRDGHDAVITSEGADEVFLNLVDGNLFWLDPTEREIPLINVVYSGYSIFLGSPCDYEKCSDEMFNFTEGQAFIFGIQNGWMDLGLFKPKYAAKAAYLRECGQYRVATKNFLVYGRLLGPVVPTNPIPTFTSEGFGRWKTKRTAAVPDAKAMLWKSEDGHLGIFMANFVKKDVPFPISINPKEYGLKAMRYELIEITPHGKTPIRTVAGPVKMTVNLQPSSLKVLEIIPESN